MSRVKSKLLWAVLPMVALSAGYTCGAPGGISFKHEDGSGPTERGTRVHDVQLQQVAGQVYVYATFEMGPANPIDYAGGMPQWGTSTATAGAPGSIAGDVLAQGPVTDDRPAAQLPEEPKQLQALTLGQKAGGQFLPAVTFGLGNDVRVPVGKAHVVPWLFDGTLDYYAGFARPNTPVDFKLRLDLNSGRMAVWVSRRGDDDWFMLVEDVPLINQVQVINHVQVEQYPGAPEIHDLTVRTKPWAPGERVQPHPLAKTDRVVGPGRGFTFQSLRSTWRKPGKHVTIAREPEAHHGWPDVVQAGPDHLVCVWSDFAHTGGRKSLSMAHSYDMGRTWTDATVIRQEDDAHCPRIQRLKDGALLITCSKDQTKTFFLDSTDGGHTWTNLRWLDIAQAGGEGVVVTSRVLELDDGSWLLGDSAFTRLPQGGITGEKLQFYRSTDRGQTWQFWSELHASPAFNLSEPSLILLPDGRILVYAREGRCDAMPAVKAISSDQGKTWQWQELPFPITGRTCASLLSDGRVMVTFRCGIGRAALRAWIGDPLDATTFQPAGAHFNDRETVGLKDGALHIDNDGMCGQFTHYNMRPPDTDDSTVDMTAEVKVIRNNGRAATLAVPFAGKFRMFRDHVELSHDPSLRVEVSPGEFHIYRVVAKQGHFQLYVDGLLALETDKCESRRSAAGFGSEARGTWVTDDEIGYSFPDVYERHIRPEVTGYSIWRRAEQVLEDPVTGRHEISWVASRDGFPDQYQLDHILEVEATVSGHDNGYSGWIELDDGRIFVVNYTDDASYHNGLRREYFIMGIPWVRGTFLLPGDLPPANR